jgi:hypothetical protein
VRDFQWLRLTQVVGSSALSQAGTLLRRVEYIWKSNSQLVGQPLDLQISGGESTRSVVKSGVD